MSSLNCLQILGSRQVVPGQVQSCHNVGLRLLARQVKICYKVAKGLL